MYVAVKGGEQAIEASLRLLDEERRGDPEVPELSLEQIKQQMTLAVDRVMSEGALFDRDLAALAIKQARGDLIEAIFLLRAYRTTLPRLAVSAPLDTSRMTLKRRISAIFKDVPGGQVLGPTFDYSHRLLDFSLAELARDESLPEEELPPAEPLLPAEPLPETMPRLVDILNQDGLIEQDFPDDPQRPVGDLTREPLPLPAGRDIRLQNLARGDEGFLLALGYSSQRGYGHVHPFAGEIRHGHVAVEIVPEELGFAIEVGEVDVTECHMVTQFTGSAEAPPQFTNGYGLTYGQGERKAMAMALVDRSLRAEELGEEPASPSQDQEFVLSHSDNVEASGFLQHLKLPHYVDFQSELALVRRLREEHDKAHTKDQDRQDAAE
ncbi:carbon-phosphorus lyase complex subunit PhnI [Fodinicurvata halophila]|uniref:Carbon-phosphorus lyase complex subunit PhnI n=1 Tax=Fodinicurvata halophila TaxID=1419723 RepID=A0ABV8UNP3_9PROT